MSKPKFDLKDFVITKKDNTKEPWDEQKLMEAINKSAVRARAIDLDEGENGKLSDREMNKVLYEIESELMERKSKKVTSAKLHSIVERVLKQVCPDVGEAYFNYHSYRLAQAQEYEEIMRQCNDANQYGDLNNANADSTLASTLKCFSADYLETSRFQNYFLTAEEKELEQLGYLYFHDKSGRLIYPFNCCLFNIGYVMEHGCELNGVAYTKPSTLSSAFTVMSDFILMNASQQYGGFTVPRVDSILAPYAEKTYKDYVKEYLELGVEKSLAEKTAEKRIIREMEQGFQGLEYKLNTVASSRGDYPFTTFTLGLDTTKWGQLLAITCLNVRANGQGEKGKKKPVLFPKLVFLYDKNLHKEGCINHEVFKAGLACSKKAMYPDYLSLTGEGYISSMYKKYGIDGVISPMGCRAFLSPWYERGGMYPADDDDKVVYEGRFNLGVVSLNLPMIYQQAKQQNKDFFENLDYYLEVIRQFHLRTIEYIGHIKAIRNPSGFCYGGLYGGHLKPNEEIAPVLKSATVSFGITALNELEVLASGESIYKNGEFALETLNYINEKITQFKNEDHVLYAIYGTPAEKLCGLQVKKFRESFGVIEGVSDREYFSNSFHCHVTEDITPIQKQNSEYRFWEKCNGGKIQYCRYHLDYNTKAIETLVERAMDMGLYEGINLSLNFCDDCGYEAVDLEGRCPKCGGYHITTIDRMNGYLGYSRQGRYTEAVTDKNGAVKIEYHGRFNKAKAAEIAERVSM